MLSGRSNCCDQAPALTTTLPARWLALLVTTRQAGPSASSLRTRSARNVPSASAKSRARVPTRRRGLMVWPFFGSSTALRVTARPSSGNQLAQFVGAQPFGDNLLQASAKDAGGRWLRSATVRRSPRYAPGPRRADQIVELAPEQLRDEQSSAATCKARNASDPASTCVIRPAVIHRISYGSAFGR